MLAIKPQANCSALETEIGRIWSSQQAATDAAQVQFHAEEKKRLDSERGPLQQQISSNRGKLTSLAGQVRELDTAIQNLREQTDSLERQMAPLRTEIAQIEADYQGVPPPPTVARYEDLRQRFNLLICQIIGLDN